MNNGLLVSAIIPTLNRPQRTMAAVESVLAQTWRPLELIVVDDGSTYEAAEQLEDALSHCSSAGVEIVFHRQANQGPSFARNSGLSLARGHYVAFLDSDDTWLPEKLERQMRVLNRFPECSGCFSDTRCVDDANRDESAFRLFGRRYSQPSGIDREASQLLAKSFCGFFLSALVVSTELVRAIGGLDPEIVFAEDRDLYFRLSLVTPLAYINELLVRGDRSATPAGSSYRPWDKVEVRLQGHERMYEKWLKLDPVPPPELCRAIRRGLQTTHSQWANWHLENRRYDRARQAVSRAIHYHVSPKMSVKWAITWAAPAIAARMSAKEHAHL
jgi:glycosyltransferase involved in cell wall biosynthesis